MFITQRLALLRKAANLVTTASDDAYKACADFETIPTNEDAKRLAHKILDDLNAAYVAIEQLRNLITTKPLI